MKKNTITTYLMILAAVLLFTSCKTKETIARLPRPEKPFLKMDINNVPWQGNKVVYRVATSSATSNPKNRINMWGGIYAMQNDTAVYFLEELDIMLIEKKLGKQKIKFLDFSQMIQEYTTFSDTTPVYTGMGTSHQMGEMICERYEVDDTKDNWVEIVQQEEDYKYVWGKFHLNMIRVRTCPSQGIQIRCALLMGSFI